MTKGKCKIDGKECDGDSKYCREGDHHYLNSINSTCGDYIHV
jgi:hypothetical protein